MLKNRELTIREMWATKSTILSKTGPSALQGRLPAPYFGDEPNYFDEFPTYVVPRRINENTSLNEAVYSALNDIKELVPRHYRSRPFL